MNSNGAVEDFDSWFQPLLFQRHFKHPGYLRRELARLMETANQHHVQPRLGQRTIAQYRRGKRLRQLPAKLKLDLDPFAHHRGPGDLHSLRFGARPDTCPTAGDMMRGLTRTHENGAYHGASGWCEVDAHWC